VLGWVLGCLRRFIVATSILVLAIVELVFVDDSIGGSANSRIKSKWSYEITREPDYEGGVTFPRT